MTHEHVYAYVFLLHRLELIDDAMLRPGRLGKLLYVPLPDATDRIAILRALVRSVIMLTHPATILHVSLSWIILKMHDIFNYSLSIFCNALSYTYFSLLSTQKSIIRWEGGRYCFDRGRSSYWRWESVETLCDHTAITSYDNLIWTSGFSGADMAALVREAGLAVVRELMSNNSHPVGFGTPAVEHASGGKIDHCPSSATSSSEGAVRDATSSGDGGLTVAHTEEQQPPVCISARHFESALQRVRPSVALQDRQRWVECETMASHFLLIICSSLLFNLIHATTCLCDRYERVHQNIKDGMGAIEALSAAAKKPPIRWNFSSR